MCSWRMATMPRWTDPIHRRHPVAWRAASVHRRWLATVSSATKAAIVTALIANAEVEAAPSSRNDGTAAIVTRLRRLARNESLARVHACAVATLALECEPTDPRL